MIQHLGHRLEPFLPALVAICTKMLAAATRNLPGATAGGAAAAVQSEEDDRSREVRVTALKMMAQV